MYLAGFVMPELDALAGTVVTVWIGMGSAGLFRGAAEELESGDQLEMTVRDGDQPDSGRKHCHT